MHAGRFGLLIMLPSLLMAVPLKAQQKDSIATRLLNDRAVSALNKNDLTETIRVQENEAGKDGRGTYIVIGAVLGSAVGLVLHSAGYLGTYEAPVLNMMVFGVLGGLAGAVIYNRRN
jgi:hypothetical protein